MVPTTLSDLEWFSDIYEMKHHAASLRQLSFLSLLGTELNIPEEKRSRITYQLVLQLRDVEDLSTTWNIVFQERQRTKKSHKGLSWNNRCIYYRSFVTYLRRRLVVDFIDRNEYKLFYRLYLQHLEAYHCHHLILPSSAPAGITSRRSS